MKKFFAFVAAVCMAMTMSADGLVYTLMYANAPGAVNGYAATSDVTVDGIVWNVPGNAQMDPARIGGKSLDGVDRVLFSKTPIANNISKIEIEHGTAAGITVNSMTVIVASDTAFATVISTLTPTFAASAVVTVERPEGQDWSNAYYKIVYNVTVEGSSNKFFQFKNAKFYGDGDPITPEPEPQPQDTIVINAGDTITCEVAAKAALAGDTTEVYVKGYVTSIQYAWQNGSMSFWMADSVKGGNVFEAYKCVVDSALAPEVTDLVLAHGKLTKYNTTPEFKQGCTVEILEKGEGPDTTLIDVTNCETAAKAALSVSANNVLYNDSAVYTVEGYVTAIQYAWSAGTMTFWMSDADDGKKVLEAYKCAIENEADAPKVGDKVAVTGCLTKYNTTPEFAQGCTCVILQSGEAAKNLGEKTIAEFLELKNVKDTCILHGTILNLPADTTANAWIYGNFDLADETDTIYIYGLLTPDGKNKQFASMGLKNGSEIKIKAIYTEYNGKPQVANAILILDVENISVTEAIAISKTLGDNETTLKSYAVAGYVKKIQKAYSADYKNISFYMVDMIGDQEDLQARNCKISEADGSALAVGDHVLVVGKITNNFYEEKNNAQIFEGQVSVEWKSAIENILINDTKINKVIVDGVLYIVRDGKLYDVRGAQVR